MLDKTSSPHAEEHFVFLYYFDFYLPKKHETNDHLRKEYIKTCK